MNAYKGFYGILGGGIPDRPFYPHHHAKFDVDESAMRKGTEFICRYVCDFLK
jgi:metal-dependent amidase/aminoacylase/carboxypeptidase family protein